MTKETRKGVGAGAGVSWSTCSELCKHYIAHRDHASTVHKDGSRWTRLPRLQRAKLPRGSFQADAASDVVASNRDGF